MHDHGACFETRPSGAPQHEVNYRMASRKMPHPEEAAKRPSRRAHDGRPSSSMPDAIATGWDLGGAHLKVAQIDGAGRLRTAQQLPCTLWRGLEHLAEALAVARRQLLPSARHGVTMTGELTDLFVDRADGVHRLAPAPVAAINAGELSFSSRSPWVRNSTPPAYRS